MTVPLETACAQGDVAAVRAALRAGERPTSAWAQRPGYQHLTLADLAAGSHSHDPVVYFRAGKPQEAGSSGLLAAEGQIKRLLAAADPKYLELHADLGPAWLERATQLLSEEEEEVLDWPAPAALPTEARWGQREMALEKVFDHAALVDVLDEVFVPSPRDTPDVSDGDDGDARAASLRPTPEPTSEEVATTPKGLGDLPADLLTVVIRLASGGKWLRVLDYAAVCRDWRAAAVACARRDAGAAAAAPAELVAPLRRNIPHRERPLCRLTYLTGRAELTRASKLAPKAAEALTKHVSWSRPRLERAAREESLSWSTSTSLDAQHCRKSAGVGTRPPPLRQSSVSKVLGDASDALRVDEDNVGGSEVLRAEMRAKAVEILEAVALWLLRNGLRAVSVRIAHREAGPEWWEEVFGDMDAIVEEHVLLLGGGDERGARSLATILTSVHNDADDFMESGRMGAC
jgi:hypothetical protein